MTLRSKIVASTVLAVAVGCNAPDARPRPVLLTSADFEALLAKQTDPEQAILPDSGLPDGLKLRRIIESDNGAPTLALHDTFTDGYRSQYVTTEAWAGFPAVWIQPVYQPVTGYTATGSPMLEVEGTESWHYIFGVGPKSAFYSPYWQIVYFRRAPGTTLDDYKTPRDVIDRGLDFNPSGGRVIALVPDDLKSPAIMDGGPEAGKGWLNGARASYLDFGSNTFTWDEYGVVEEAPLFVWVVRDDDGVTHALDIPSVAGAGPLYSGRQPVLQGTTPKYGSYWRIYTVVVPSGAAVFAPPHYTDLRNGLAARPSLYDVTYAPEVLAATGHEYDNFAGRVTTTPDCFATDMKIDPSNFGTDDQADACQYLDSQTKIEAAVPEIAIERTDILVTCPFVVYDGVPVKP
ncbi:MAG TPA: hypothetical protein VHJ20_09010 [Polyangia bacterium]|nr:hypothetical protein [Polyangia bacterium]